MGAASSSDLVSALASSPNIDPRTFRVLSGIDANTLTSDMLTYGLSTITLPAILAVVVGLASLTFASISCSNHCRCRCCGDGKCRLCCRVTVIPETSASEGRLSSHVINAIFILTVLSTAVLFLAFTAWMLLTAETGQFNALVTQLGDYQSNLLTTTREGEALINTTIASLSVIHDTAGNHSWVVESWLAEANTSLHQANDQFRTARSTIDVNLYLDDARTWSSNLRLWIGLAGGGVLLLFLLFMFPSAVDTLGQTILGACDRYGRWWVSVRPLKRRTRCCNLASVLVWSILLVPISIGMAVAFYALSEAMAEICRIGPYQIARDFVHPSEQVQYYFDACNATASIPFQDELDTGRSYLQLATLRVESVLNTSMDYNLTETAAAAQETLLLLGDDAVLFDRMAELANCSHIAVIKKDALVTLCDHLPTFLFLMFLGFVCSIPLLGLLYMCISMRPSQPISTVIADSAVTASYDGEDNREAQSQPLVANGTLANFQFPTYATRSRFRL